MDVPYTVAAPAAQGQLRRLVDVAEQLDDRALLASSRCLGWTRADVLTHVHLALQDMLLGLVDPTDAEPNTDAASYWRADPPSNDPDSDELDNLRFATPSDWDDERAVLVGWRRLPHPSSDVSEEGVSGWRTG